MFVITFAIGKLLGPVVSTLCYQISRQVLTVLGRSRLAAIKKGGNRALRRVAISL